MPSIKTIVAEELKANPNLGTTSLVERVRITAPSANYATVTRHRRAWLALNTRSSVIKKKTWELYQKVNTPDGKEGVIQNIELNGKGEQLIAVKIKSKLKYYKGNQLF